MTAKPVNLVVVSRLDELGTENLPYDVIEPGRQLPLGLHALFPTLSRTVVATLGSAHLDALYKAVERERPGVLSNSGTMNFLLRHVFGIAAELVLEPPDLLRVLLRIHHRGQSIPPLLGQHFVQALQREDRFLDWPLERIVPDRDAFFVFLQERWPLFLDGLVKSEAAPAGRNGDLAYPGPTELPFEHDDVRVYIDNLFLEGFLRPVAHEAADSIAGTWMSAGVQAVSGTTDAQRLNRLVVSADDEVPSQDGCYGDWLRFARTWAEVAALGMATDNDGTATTAESSLLELRSRVDDAFAGWLGRRYAGLATLPPVPPVMLHHVPHLLSRHLDAAPGHRAALLVVDGLSMDQWVVVREELARRRPGYSLREDAVFAWIPTLTSVSRQAAFAGRQPFYFPRDSIHSTAREPKLWRHFWADRGLAGHAVVYKKKLGIGSLDSVAGLISHRRVRVAGLVVDTVDKIMHSMELGARGMHGQVRQWSQEPYLAALLDLLLENGFAVWLTSDHGNVEATGCRRPSAGDVAELRGKRVHVYASASLQRRAAKESPDARRWPPTGLPPDYLPLFAPRRSAFVREGERIVGHGGASLEEVVVAAGADRHQGRRLSDGASRVIGLSQRVRLEWLDEAAHLTRTGQNRAEAWSALVEMLRDKVSVGGTAARGNREKTVTILTRTWCGPPPQLIPLRDAGLRLLDGATPASRLAVHWGMTMAAYPSGASLQPRPAGSSVCRALLRRPRSSVASKSSTASAPPSPAPLVAFFGRPWTGKSWPTRRRWAGTPPASSIRSKRQSWSAG